VEVSMTKISLKEPLPDFESLKKVLKGERAKNFILWNYYLM